MKPSTKASILGVLLFAGVVAVMAYIQRKASPVADNVIQFPEYEANGQKFYWV